MEGVTRESMRPLLELQRLDSAIDRLVARLADLPEQRALDELSGRRDEALAAHTEKAAELDGVAREQAKLDNDVALVTDKIERDTARLYSGEVGNAKELASIQAEVDALKRRKTALEDQDLEVMERREELEAEAAELSKNLAALEAEVAEAGVARDKAREEIDRELAALRREREGVAPSLHAEVLTLYDEVRAKQGGIGAGAFENGTCGACRLPLSPMAREEIRSSDDPIVRCENCRRLLVIV